MSPFNSKILISKQKIIDLFPRIEKTLESIKDADNTVMQMQIKRQREFWHLLKIACVSYSALIVISWINFAGTYSMGYDAKSKKVRCIEPQHITLVGVYTDKPKHYDPHCDPSTAPHAAGWDGQYVVAAQTIHDRSLSAGTHHCWLGTLHSSCCFWNSLTQWSGCHHMAFVKVAQINCSFPRHPTMRSVCSINSVEWSYCFDSSVYRLCRLCLNNLSSLL